MSEYEQRLQAFVGREIRAWRPGPDPVNRPMIRHWTEAMGDDNPIYVDDEAARRSGRDGVVAPASMAQAWAMRGYVATVHPQQTTDTDGELADLLAEGGYTSVVATDSEFSFDRELGPGDHIGVAETVESISPEKNTALGTGRFVTTVKTYRDTDGALIATQRWRTLRFRPVDTDDEQPRAQRPRPALNDDNRFWFDAALEHRLVIQRCTECESLRHPPGPCCPECGSFEWDTVEACGRGSVYSFVVNHHPRHPAFDYPLVVAVIDLVEGTRLISNLVGVQPENVVIGMPVSLEWLDSDQDLSLPVFRPSATEDSR